MYSASLVVLLAALPFLNGQTITTPDLVTIITTPGITVPEVTTPTLPGITIPTLPGITTPLPIDPLLAEKQLNDVFGVLCQLAGTLQLTLPQCDATTGTPLVGVTTPAVTVPGVTLPEVTTPELPVGGDE